MKKHIDKSCLQGNNVITLIKRFIKHKIKQYKKEETIMLQQVMTNPGEIIFREVPVPEVKENQVLVKIMNIGVCGSDIHVYHGKHPFTKYPVTQGHEVSGEITELGKNVTEFQVGQKVTIEPQVYCGHCYPCRHGKYNLCEELKVMGFQTTGTASVDEVTPKYALLSTHAGRRTFICNALALGIPAQVVMKWMLILIK